MKRFYRKELWQSPANGCTKRQDMREVLDVWERHSPELRDKLLGALRSSDIWDCEI